MGTKASRTSESSGQSACSLPEGYELETLCKMKGAWPLRDPSSEELLETYKGYYGCGARAEVLLLLDAVGRRYGDGVFEVVEETLAKMGKQDGESDLVRYGSLLEKLADIIVRPFCCEFDVSEATNERIAFRVLKCPFAELVRKMSQEQIGSRMCPAWHKAYANAFGYRFTMPKFMLTGDDSCDQIWERLPTE